MCLCMNFFKVIQEILNGHSICKILLGSMFNIQCKLSEMLIDASNEWHFEIRKFSNFQSGCKHPEQTKTNKGEKLVQAKSLFKNYIAIQAFIRSWTSNWTVCPQRQTPKIRKCFCLSDPILVSPLRFNNSLNDSPKSKSNFTPAGAQWKMTDLCWGRRSLW